MMRELVVREEVVGVAREKMAVREDSEVQEWGEVRVQAREQGEAREDTLPRVTWGGGMPVVLLEALAMSQLQSALGYWQQWSVHRVWRACPTALQHHKGPHLGVSTYGLVPQSARQ